MLSNCVFFWLFARHGGIKDWYIIETVKNWDIFYQFLLKKWKTSHWSLAYMSMLIHALALYAGQLWMVRQRRTQSSSHVSKAQQEGDQSLARLWIRNLFGPSFLDKSFKWRNSPTRTLTHQRITGPLLQFGPTRPVKSHLLPLKKKVTSWFH